MKVMIDTNIIILCAERLCPAFFYTCKNERISG